MTSTIAGVRALEASALPWPIARWLEGRLLRPQDLSPLRVPKIDRPPAALIGIKEDRNSLIMYKIATSPGSPLEL